MRQRLLLARPISTRGAEEEMTQIEDVLRAIPHVVSAIEERANWGIEYRDQSLESKRRSAILWLRSDKSKRGWVRDRVINCKREGK